ncbi:hypothetical protein FRC01_000675 [Tulasnella sp. 417]|nr:hypothetical protein FRC01_000675 [Tulasnella sp. 417]
MDYEQLRGNLNDALAKLEHLSIKEDLVEISEALRCTAGGYGDVYRATLQESGGAWSRFVAVKELRAVGDDATRIRLAIRLTRELRVWTRLKHPNVLELVGYHLNPQMTTARLISPFMANGNIDGFLENTPGPASDSLRLKLDNVLITDQVEAVLCDFGLARLADGQPSGLTTSKTIKGSTRYMSPELLEEDAIHTLSSDVWAFGCLVLKVMTGSLPYARARTDQQIILALVLNQPPSELADSELRDDALKTLLTKCWDRNPPARPSVAACLLHIPEPWTSDVQLRGARVNLSSDAGDLPYLGRPPSPINNGVSDSTPSFHGPEIPPLQDEASEATTSGLIPPGPAEPAPPDSPPKLDLRRECARPAATLAPPNAFQTRIGPLANPTPSPASLSSAKLLGDPSTVTLTRKAARIVAPQYPLRKGGPSGVGAASVAKNKSQTQRPTKNQPPLLQRPKDSGASKLSQNRSTKRAVEPARMLHQVLSNYKPPLPKTANKAILSSPPNVSARWKHDAASTGSMEALQGGYNPGRKRGLDTSDFLDRTAAILAWRAEEAASRMASDRPMSANLESESEFPESNIPQAT